RSRPCAIASPWRRSCRSTASRRMRCCARCWPGWRRRASERVAHPCVRIHGGGPVRPGIALLVLLGLCAAAGVLPLAGWAPLWTWWALVAAIALIALADALRLRAIATPQLQRHL